MNHEEQIRHMMSQLPPKPNHVKRSKLALALAILGVFLALVSIGLSFAAHCYASPPPMCFDPANRMSVLCAGTQQYLPPGYNTDNPNTWFPCWYSRQGTC